MLTAVLSFSMTMVWEHATKSIKIPYSNDRQLSIYDGHTVCHFFDAGPICNMSASVGCLPVHRQRLDKSQTRPATACAVLNMAFSEARCHAAAGLKCFHVIGHRLKILILEDESTAGHDYCSSST